MFELKLLEYPQILDIIASYAVLNETKEAIKKIEPSSDKDEVLRLLKETDEMKEAIIRFGLTDIDPFVFKESLERLRLGAPIQVNEFLELLKLILNSSRIQIYYKKWETAGISLVVLNESIGKMVSLETLKEAIYDVMDESGAIFDNASPDLTRIRKRIKSEEGRLSEKMDSILRNEASKLSDTLITIRDGRKVLPVKAECKSQIPGVVYGESASGQTVFIEPYVTIEIENSIADLKEQEKREIDRILYALSVNASTFYESIAYDYEAIVHEDFVASKAYYAREIQAIRPEIQEEINLINARHPLIDPKVVVPNTIALKKNETMIITGPNTGGKTVVLKTLGLLSLMAQSGILIPVSEGSTTTILKGVYADIGDEQSIAQSLSTFSSHMTRIVRILKEATPSSLVLLDELGSGTDPREGASLAIAVVDYLRKENLFSVATTHYPELKAYAYSHDGVINASVEFDVDTLKPTYRLLSGIPGKSNAFLISKRLGLPDDIIEAAKNVSSEFSDHTSDLIMKLEEEAAEVNRMKEKYASLIKEESLLVDESRSSLSEERSRLNKRLQDINTQRNQILEKTQREADRLLADIQKLKNEMNEGKEVKDNVIIEAKSKVSSLYEDKLIKLESDHKEIKVGDHVRVLSFDKVGTVSEIKGKKYTVSLGSLTSVFKLDEIEYVGSAPSDKKVYAPKESTLNINVESRLDLRGMRYEEALEALDSFIDQAALTNLDKVEVIHGYGTLALRNMVINYAKTHDIIKSYRPGGETEGGNGVTVMYLK